MLRFVPPSSITVSFIVNKHKYYTLLYGFSDILCIFTTASNMCCRRKPDVEKTKIHAEQILNVIK